MNPKREVDIAEIRKRLNGLYGQQYWRSLEELAGTEEFQNYLHREFPENASQWTDPVSRRNFLKLMGASLALAGVTACTRQPEERILPYVRQPEEIIPGKPLFFATAMTLSGIATGLLVESHMGRPTKVEGNPDHPASLGATDVFSQASVLNLYDPDRSQAITYLGNIGSWSSFLETIRLRLALETQRSIPGSGLRFLTESISSPTIIDLFGQILKQYPGAKWYQYEPNGRDEVYEGSRLAFGQYLETIYRFGDADVVVSLGSDFLNCGPGNVRYTRDFASRRKIRNGQARMNRLYTIESTPSNTGAKADHCFAIRESEMIHAATELAAQVGVPDSSASQTSGRYPWMAAIARDLQQHRGGSIVIAGDHQPASVHAIAHAINSALGNSGKTLQYTDPIVANPGKQLESLRLLTQEMNAGTVQTLVILGSNPVFTAPADFDFARALSKVPLRIHQSLYDDETSNLCHWHIPETHYLESWGDARAYDGTASIVQPLIAPLYEGSKSPIELLATMTGNPEPKAYNIIREYWQKQNPAADFESFWRKSVHNGLIANTAFPVKNAAVSFQFPAQASKDVEGLELIFRPDPTIYDGRFANNGWLQELPKPLTKLTWDNVAHISPADAQKFALQNQDQIELQVGSRKVVAAVWILPGQAQNCVTVHFGYGRVKVGNVGNGVGFNAYPLRTSNTLWSAADVKIAKTGDRYPLACTQNHNVMEGRHIVRSGSLQEFLAHPDFAKAYDDGEPKPVSLYPDYKYEGYKWGMAIDQGACVGCNACVIACQSENNSPIVGKTEVMRGREMQWLRIDRYYEGGFDQPKTLFQPMLCQHCEHAPCEVVCPVNATVHSSEGLNEMVYNRCVGTRYCSNNCPYKVRRFNFFLYSDIKTPTLKLLRNPDVTVRTRGVMEKCTYCVQRINYAKIEAEKQDRKIHDGEIVTACQQVCPAEAIVFGDLNDPSSKVAKLKKESLNYEVLRELNTVPRTSYLAIVRNPNPELEKQQQPKEE
jgi:MoCo/4Fe-4S cofactor protein with predicted Tat translocation signal